MRKHRKSKKQKNSSSFYKPYDRCRNFAEFRCYRVLYDGDYCFITEFLETVTGKYSYNSTHCFFLNKSDAITFRLRFPPRFPL